LLTPILGHNQGVPFYHKRFAAAIDALSSPDKEQDMKELYDYAPSQTWRPGPICAQMYHENDFWYFACHVTLQVKRGPIYADRKCSRYIKRVFFLLFLSNLVKLSFLLNYFNLKSHNHHQSQTRVFGPQFFYLLSTHKK